MSSLSGLIRKLGLSSDAPKSCFIAQTLSTTYGVCLSDSDLRLFYIKHYDKAVENLRYSVINYQKSPSLYVSNFHQFMHITFITFYEYTLPSESGIYEKGCAELSCRKVFRDALSRGIRVWEELNSMRNRVEHPVDRKTKLHSKNA